MGSSPLCVTVSEFLVEGIYSEGTEHMKESSSTADPNVRLTTDRFLKSQLQSS